MKLVPVLMMVFISIFAFAKADKKAPSRSVASKNAVGVKIRIDDEQAKTLFFAIEKKGAKRSGNASPIIQYELDNIVCTGVNSHGENAVEGFSCEIDL
jgi:butyrate kinase